MDFNPNSNHYELLDVAPDASPQEIRAAYVRAKASFQKDSMAIYSLMDPTEAQGMVEKIERAYQILSQPELKRAYDRDYLFHQETEAPPSQQPSAFSSAPEKIVSIDRVPPMESSLGDELLVAPTTDYRSAPAVVEEAVAVQEPTAPAVEEWTGELIRRTREMRNFPIERLVEITRIRRSYLTALEQEDFAKLPAPVFVRGFLMQVARELKVPADRLVSSYLARYEKWSISQSGKSR